MRALQMPEGTELARLWLGPSAVPEDAANNSASTLFLAAAGHAVQTGVAVGEQQTLDLSAEADARGILAPQHDLRCSFRR